MHLYLVAKKGVMCYQPVFLAGFLAVKTEIFRPYFEIILDISENSVILLLYTEEPTALGLSNKVWERRR
jgi:hypothetical protein